MKISVVIPVYNEEQNIEKCLKSLLLQIEKADEIIVVNNNCTDSTIKIAKKLNATIIAETKQGIINARNTGFNFASGDIIARTDADAVLPFDWIKKIKENFVKNKIDALTGPIYYKDLPLKITLFARFYLNITKIFHSGETLIGPNMALTKIVWEKIKNNVCLNDSNVHEDIDLAIHINKIGGKIIKDLSLVVEVSARRIKKNPISFFIEYPFRFFRTYYIHNRK